MNVLIIEDEDLAVRKLTKVIADVDPSVIIRGVTGSIEDSVTWLRQNPSPDLILLDIELSDGQSFEIFSQVRVNSFLVFTTSYDEHILPAFRLSSFDYLLKPILREDLSKSLARVRRRMQEFKLAGQSAGNDYINMENLINELKGHKN